MDWAWMYGALCRWAGWTYRKAGKQPACDVFAFMEFLAENPPADLILAAVHMPDRKKKPLTDEAVTELQSLLGPAEPMPDSVREQLDWMEAFDGGIAGQGETFV